MPLTTERERRQQAELIRLSEELARKTAMIAALQAANLELHDRLQAATARGTARRRWSYSEDEKTPPG